MGISPTYGSEMRDSKIEVHIYIQYNNFDEESDTGEYLFDGKNWPQSTSVKKRAKLDLQMGISSAFGSEIR